MPKIDFQIPEIFAPLVYGSDDKLFPHYDYIFLRGGRGGAKSRFLTSLAVMEMRYEAHRFLCVREIMNSIKFSSWQSVKDEIDRKRLGQGADGTGEFEVTDNQIRHTNGSYMIFKGVRNNIEEIKGMEGITRVWGDEAKSFSQLSLDVIGPTVRRNKGAQQWYSYNPENETDPVHALANSKPSNSIVIECSLDDNPWADESMFRLRAEEYARDPDKAAWIWGGKCLSRSNAQVLGGRYKVYDFEPASDWDGPYFGLDFGFAQDPSHAVEVYKHSSTLYFRREARGIGVDIDRLPEMLMKLPGAEKRAMRCDNSRPETISYLKRYGYPQAMSCRKWPGSVEDGVSWLRSHDIVIHPDCPHLAEEARLYAYKVDRLTGDIMPEIIDAHNHGWDAARYALEPMIFGKTERPKIFTKSSFMPSATMWQ